MKKYAIIATHLGCKFCKNPDADNEYLLEANNQKQNIDKTNLWAWIENNRLYVEFDMYGAHAIADVEIGFCPICGKRLGEWRGGPLNAERNSNNES